jgi:hypothetical protein
MLIAIQSQADEEGVDPMLSTDAPYRVTSPATRQWSGVYAPEAIFDTGIYIRHVAASGVHLTGLDGPSLTGTERLALTRNARMGTGASDGYLVLVSDQRRRPSWARPVDEAQVL